MKLAVNQQKSYKITLLLFQITPNSNRGDPTRTFGICKVKSALYLDAKLKRWKYKRKPIKNVVFLFERLQVSSKQKSIDHIDERRVRRSWFSQRDEERHY